MAVADFHSLYLAWRSCRRRKGATPQAQFYHVHLLDNLVETAQALEEGRWRPAPPVCFGVTRPKARELHAAPFGDRVVHHWLVPRLEVLFEPVFIHDVYSNRRGKGTHGASARLQGFMQSCAAAQPQATPACGAQGYYLQLDIKNFFYSISKPILFRLIQKRLSRCVRTGRITADEAFYLRDLVHTILKQDIGNCATPGGDKTSLASIPAHKRLANARPDHGLPIGNLTSQFFANVYLNELDQYVKHTLKCRYYLRYVDDFLLLHGDPRQLQQWRDDIERFLAERLDLRLHDKMILRPNSDGANFLGYIVKPRYRLVRRRIVGNLRDRLDKIAQQLLRYRKTGEQVLNLSAANRQQLQSTLASYLGHFRHAHSRSLISALFRWYPWLSLLYVQRDMQLLPRWEPPAATRYQMQQSWFRRHFARAQVRIQRGTDMDMLKPLHTGEVACVKGAIPLVHSVSQVTVREQGYLRCGLKRRVLEQLVLRGEPLLA